jgi:biotin transport system ATP-binding protein
MININNVSHHYNGVLVIDDITLTLSEKKIAIIGANGSGKSTFVRMLNGLVKPTNGNICIGYIDIGKDIRSIRKKVGFVFQNPDNQIVFPTVEEDISFGLKNLKTPQKEIDDKVNAILEKYNMQHLHNKSCHLLSGGEKQMVAILSVLVMEPEIIIFDEPTTQLDLKNKIRISNTISELEQNVIVISHDMDQIKNFDRVIMFDKGKIAKDGTPSDVIPYYIEKITLE